YSFFKNNINKEMKYEEIINIFGHPDRITGSGILIAVYNLNDDTEIWIGYTDKILYVRHVSKNMAELDLLF
ncbi:MAG: hypothetical protein JW982_07470, partial [Spirochaetes bacterium]|nr:hypothetical protein [Spirochaetota bacterium]